MRARIISRTIAARAWVNIWGQGRGRPVDQNALEESGAVSGAFIERVSELANTLGGDGVELIKALRAGKIERFRSDNTQGLEDFLLEAGYIDEEEPYSAEERARQTLLRAAGKGDPEKINKVVTWWDKGVPESH